MSATNLPFGGPDSEYIYVEDAVSGTIYRFKTPHPGLIGPGPGSSWQRHSETAPNGAIESSIRRVIDCYVATGR